MNGYNRPPQWRTPPRKTSKTKGKRKGEKEEEKMIVTAGKYKGHRRGDVADVMWTPGYHLPTVFNGQGATLVQLCMQKISDRRMNIDQLPVVMRWRVNQHHLKYGVRIITDSRYFTAICNIHATGRYREKCRQCKRRGEAWYMLMLRVQKLHITEGLLISDEKRMKIKKETAWEKLRITQEERGTKERHEKRVYNTI